MATAGLPLALTSPGSWIHEDSDPRWTGAAKLRPPSVEHTATTWPIMSPDASGMVVQSQVAHTRPSGPAASVGPALVSEAAVDAGKMVRGGSKLFPPSVERVKPRADPNASASELPAAAQTT
jgi:hypothetical protein